jgi:hypothetical protein
MITNVSRVCVAILLGGLLASVSACNDSAETQTVRAKTARRTAGSEGVHHERKSTRRQQSGYANDPPKTFKGYMCTQDCSGHEAGYQWAEEHDIDDPDDCGGNSESFIEGCQAYAEEQEHDSEDDSDRED